MDGLWQLDWGGLSISTQSGAVLLPTWFLLGIAWYLFIGLPISVVYRGDRSSWFTFIIGWINSPFVLVALPISFVLHLRRIWKLPERLDFLEPQKGEKKKEAPDPAPDVKTASTDEDRMDRHDRLIAGLIDDLYELTRLVRENLEDQDAMEASIKNLEGCGLDLPPYDRNCFRRGDKVICVALFPTGLSTGDHHHVRTLRDGPFFDLEGVDGKRAKAEFVRVLYGSGPSLGDWVFVDDGHIIGRLDGYGLDGFLHIANSVTPRGPRHGPVFIDPEDDVTRIDPASIPSSIRYYLGARDA